MRLTESESQNEKSFKFDDNHDVSSISSQEDRVILFGSRQIGDVRRGYIYQMCHNDPGTKESGNSFSQIGNGIINTIDFTKRVSGFFTRKKGGSWQFDFIFIGFIQSPKRQFT